MIWWWLFCAGQAGYVLGMLVTAIQDDRYAARVEAEHLAEIERLCARFNSQDGAS